ncbi:MAG: hypothetical protein LBW85_11025 [Deltaproteobacteria bacterium]|jgi:hypothetical protein|nr:hypothetical protein [Deltaproteobacteria bacterium]
MKKTAARALSLALILALGLSFPIFIHARAIKAFLLQVIKAFNADVAKAEREYSRYAAL